VISVGIGAPALLAYLTGKQRREEKLEDYARQDLVAERAEKAARNAEAVAKAAAVKAEQAARQAAVAAAKLLASNADIAVTSAVAAKATLDQLGVIHTLVNSTLTASMEGERFGAIRELALAKRLEALAVVNGLEPDPETAGLIVAAEVRLAELEAQLAERQGQTKVAEEQIRQAGDSLSTMGHD